MANPIQQGLKHFINKITHCFWIAAMANPIQQGLKLADCDVGTVNSGAMPQWLIQYNKD